MIVSCALYSYLQVLHTSWQIMVVKVGRQGDILGRVKGRHIHPLEGVEVEAAVEYVPIDLPGSSRTRFGCIGHAHTLMHATSDLQEMR